MTTQLELFDWAAPASRVAIFPYHRRADLLREIADTFVRDGMTAGNRLMMRHGCDLIREMLNTGKHYEEVGAELDRFMAAARAAACEQIHSTGMLGGEPRRTA